MDAGAFLRPISPRKSLQCRLCDDGDTYTSTDDLHDHSVAVHLPKPSPVNMPTATASPHARGAGGNASFRGLPPKEKKRRLIRRKSVAGGRGLAQPHKETEAEVHGTAVVPAASQKGGRRLLQEHHAADGASSSSSA